ncbi:MAG: hypothetical protein ACI9QQ_000985 [Myxococcota bacterium]|jgi:hypothetical protein
MTTPEDTSPDIETTGAFGDCVICARRHSLPVGQARAYALEVMEEFKSLQRLDHLACEADADPRLEFATLFATRGNMFGVMECVAEDGETVFLRAFSALTGGLRDIDGWVGPVLGEALYDEVILPAQREIKTLTAEMKTLKAKGSAVDETWARRREVSQMLWKRMCAEYKFQNFRGEIRSLEDAVLPGVPLVGGMGECCAPKLLNHAARNGLRPIGIAEFYWGKPTVSLQDVKSDKPSEQTGAEARPSVESRRVPGNFYPSCESRCQPILGFMLCGLDA